MRVWDARTGESLAALKGTRGRVLSVSWSPDGGRLASGGEDGTVRVWDARASEPLAALEGRNERYKAGQGV